jgi:Zn finger protein HypA/HybF involved in hydrogenase expression
VIEVADIFRRFADPYLAAHGAAMLPSHRRAISDILACRTEDLGGHLWQCNHCAHEVFSYHSCKNRSCPKCHTNDSERWLEARKLEMLPCPYFHVTVTVPEELRQTLRDNQKDGYALLMKAAAEAIIDIARDPRFVGGTVGVLAVLHTWTQQLHYHPHVHCLVTGGGVSLAATPCWHPARPTYLAPEGAIAKLVRGKLKAWFAAKRPDLIIPVSAWTTPWVVRITPWGEGQDAVLRYLARYVFRIAITNARIVGLDERAVSFRYKHRQSNRWRTCTLEGAEFMRRFLQHVLPKGLHKVRYFGLWHPSKRSHASNARLLLDMQRAPHISATCAPSIHAQSAGTDQAHLADQRLCPRCGRGHLVLVRTLLPKLAQGP